MLHADPLAATGSPPGISEPACPPPGPGHVARASNRLSWALLSYAVGVSALATLSPFDFRAPPTVHINLHVALHDVVVNLLLLLPAGFLFALGRAPLGVPVRVPARGHAWTALGLFGGLSLAFESAQLWLPSRTTSAVDVVANGMGAAAGALMVTRMRPWLSRTLYNQLTARLPLSHLFYLLTLLLVVDGLMARSGAERSLLCLPLGACGALLAAAIYRHRMDAGARRAHLRAAAALGLWFALASAPAWLRAPAVGLWGTALVVALFASALAVGSATARNRRFEGPTLRVLAVPFAIYLGLLFRTFATADISPSARHGGAMQHLFDGIELLAALTVLGYAVAEALGRTRLRAFQAGLCSALVVAACLALASLRWPLTAPRTPLPVVVVGGAAFAAWGAIIYRAELALARALSRRHARADRSAG